MNWRFWSVGGADDTVSARAYALIYAVVGVVAIPLLAVIVPPYQAPDELAHFYRADRVSRGVMVETSAGVISGGLTASWLEFEALQGRPDVKATADRYARAGAVLWSNSGTVPASPPATGLYPPSLYLPQAASILFGKVFDLSVLNTLTLARIVTGLVSVVIGAVAISLSAGAAPIMFVVLSLPMALSLAASVSQDGPLIALAALAVGTFISMRERRSASIPLFVLMCVSATLVAMARPPYAALAVLALLAFGRSWALRLSAVAAILSAVALWTLMVAPMAHLAAHASADPPVQIQAIFADPLRFLWIFGRSFTTAIFESFIGRLGWLEVQLPPAFLVLAGVALVVAFVMAAASLRCGPTRLQSALIVGAIVAAVFQMFLLLYVVWTPPHAITIWGVQGRYLIPFVLFAAAAVRPWWLHRLRCITQYLTIGIALFAPLSVAMTTFAIVRRYYFSS
jgi:uncharacterized membrane protein